MTTALASDIEAILRGSHSNPFAILGPHEGEVRVFAPQASEVAAVSGDRRFPLERVHPEGFFAGPVEGDHYRLEMSSGDRTWTAEDPYRFGLVLGEMDEYLLAEGRHRQLYEKLGAHPMTHEGVEGVAFAVWAPNARRVSVVGDFNAWDGRRHPMRRRLGPGIWELFIPGLSVGTLYKYEIISAHGERMPLKADPVGFLHEQSPGTASVISKLPDYSWQDAGWMAGRAERQDRKGPISIYEVHLGSWRRGGENEVLDYAAIADLLVPYVTDMGFTHVEFLPVSEHPFTGSWGYQPIGLFAPTSRYGSPEAFARLVDRLHGAGIGVIIDWVPAHFPSDAHGLGRFDGTALYEHADPRQGFHQDWNTLIYNFGRQEVANFLQASALYWLREYHIDGLRVDAVASMLYRDYSREAGQWIPNRHGGREKLVARLGHEAEDGIDALMSQALVYEQAEPPSLTGFLVWLAEDDAEVRRQPGAAGAGEGLIRVMTVHGAKGLEASVVFLVDTTTSPSDTQRLRLIHLPQGNAAPNAPGVVVWAGKKAEDPPAVADALGQRISHRLGNEGFAAAGRAVQQQAFGRAQVVGRVELRVGKRQLHGILDRLDLGRQPANIRVCDVGDLVQGQLVDLSLRDTLERVPGRGVD